MVSARSFTDRAKTLNLAESMKGYSLRLFGCAVLALGILTACIAQTTTAFRPSNQSKTALLTRVSEIRDRNNFRDEQQAAPRVTTLLLTLDAKKADCRSQRA
jgi:hypothetical protein